MLSVVASRRASERSVRFSFDFAAGAPPGSVTPPPLQQQSASRGHRSLAIENNRRLRRQLRAAYCQQEEEQCVDKGGGGGRLASLCTRAYRKLRLLFRSDAETGEPDLDEIEATSRRFQPPALETLVDETHFSKREIIVIYRGFKQECPSGVIDEAKFHEIFHLFYPLGEVASYSRHLFNAFDVRQMGYVTFEQFLLGLSALTRGPVEERLDWIFDLYDVDGTGYLTRYDIWRVVGSIYDLMGQFAHPPPDEGGVEADAHVDRIFDRFDLNGDGIISRDEFHSVGQRDAAVRSSLAAFDTKI